MATRIYTSEKFDVYEVTDPDDRKILPLGYWSLRDPFSTRGYMGLGKIFLVIDNSAPLVTNTFRFDKQENKNQVFAFLLAAKHYRNRVNEPYDLYAFLEENPEIKEIPGLKEELEKHPVVKEFWLY